MNLTYYSQHEFYNDSRPMYDELLTVTDVPTWPASVEAIELEQLRKWSPEAAEMFFRSFVENAPNLLSLRRLSIKAMLDVPWRQRCQFRDEWEGKLKRVFLRQVDGLRAVVRPGNACEKTGNQGKQYRSSRSAHAAKGTPARRSGRIATSHDPSSPSSRTVKGLREVRRGPLSYKDPDTDDDIGAASESDASGPLTDEQQHPSPAGQDEVTFIQGLCEVVDIKFDNQKPREMQYGMSDFLDLDEGREEDDDDWASGEDGDIDNDDTYAW
ncbi:hypothetical protein NKR23_g3930 [Pleurostoma richardsiae]|uniref:Uncharacterized protein n=1 Tax=Pleurostoma richardsiae TaxID=41990 RepID=A0AA38RXK8_9PEZI|nr:hypothetical protein NKR23_g3930 [Pleurostoma richardsiae]